MGVFEVLLIIDNSFGRKFLSFLRRLVPAFGYVYIQYEAIPVFLGTILRLSNSMELLFCRGVLACIIIEFKGTVRVPNGFSNMCQARMWAPRLYRAPYEYCPQVLWSHACGGNGRKEGQAAAWGLPCL
jgi:hypothetical protein